MKRYRNNEKLTDKELHARTMSSRRVTATRRDCDCPSCAAGPRRPNHMLVTSP